MNGTAMMPSIKSPHFHAKNEKRKGVFPIYATFLSDVYDYEPSLLSIHCLYYIILSSLETTDPIG